MRKQPNKHLPSGVSANFAYTHPDRFGAQDCLQQVDLAVVEEILMEMEPEKKHLSDWGVPAEFAERAEAAFTRLGMVEVTLETVWVTFNAMLRFL
jgi:hypothetical protein